MGDKPGIWERALRGEGRSYRTYVLLILEKCINNLTGTDGLRLRCRQFYTSSNYPHLPSTRSCNKRSQSLPLSQFQNSEGLAHETYPMVSQRMNGTLFLPELLIMNHTAPLRKITRSQEKPSAGSSRQQNRQAENRAEQGVATFAAGASYRGFSQRGVYSPGALAQPARPFHQSHRCGSGWKLKTGFLIPI
jgi:hypothetical protein